MRWLDAVRAHFTEQMRGQLSLLLVCAAWADAVHRCIPCACTNFATVRLLATFATEEHLLTVQQRLGMVLALLGEYDTAKQLLHEVAPALGEWHGFCSCCSCR